jgi:hypothetical protein
MNHDDRRITRIFLSFLILGSLTLSACRSEPDQAPPADQPIVEQPPASEGPTPSGSGSGDAWAVTPNAAGPIVIGASLTDALPNLEGSVDTAAIADGCAYVSARGAPEGLKFMVEERRVVRAEVASGATATAEGAKIGDTEESILARYPSARRSPHKYTDGSYLIVLAPADTVRRYVFETDGTVVTQIRAGLAPQVEYVEGCS